MQKSCMASGSMKILKGLPCHTCWGLCIVFWRHQVTMEGINQGMATHSSVLAWRTPWTEEPGGLQSMGSQSRTGWSKLHFHFLSWKDWLFRKITPATNVESRLEGEDGKQTAFLGGSWNKPGKQGWGPGGRLWNSGRRGGFQLPS